MSGRQSQILKYGSAVLVIAAFRRLFRMDLTYTERFGWAIVGLIRCALLGVWMVTLNRFIFRKYYTHRWSLSREFVMTTIQNVIHWTNRKVKQDRTHAKAIRGCMETLAIPVITVTNYAYGYVRESIQIGNVPCQIICNPQHMKYVKSLLNRENAREERNIKTLWIVYAHGGGFVLGGKSTACILSTGLLEALEREASWIPVILAVDYAMLPEAFFPKALGQMHKVYITLQRLVHSENRIVLLGDSAGGCLALATALALKGKSLIPYHVEDIYTNTTHSFCMGPQPAAIVLLSPMLNADPCKTYPARKSFTLLNQEVMNEYSLSYIGYHSKALSSNELASPLNATALEDLAPVLIQYGSEELLAEECELFFEKLNSSTTKNNKIECYEGMGHVFHNGHFLGCDMAKTALKNVVEFLRLNMYNNRISTRSVELQ